MNFLFVFQELGKRFVGKFEKLLKKAVKKK